MLLGDEFTMCSSYRFDGISSKSCIHLHGIFITTDACEIFTGNAFLRLVVFFPLFSIYLPLPQVRDHDTQLSAAGIIEK